MDVMEHRGLNPHNCDVHCGFDGGQGILKLAITITDRLEGGSRGRSHYSDVRIISILYYLAVVTFSISHYF